MEQRFDSLKVGQKFTKTFFNGWFDVTGTFVLLEGPTVTGRRVSTMVQNERGQRHMLMGKTFDKVDVQA